MPRDDSNRQRLAEVVTGAMMERDAASNYLGMRIVSVGAGTAVVTMMIKAEMLNGHLSCHGGFIFSLADSAFAFACNSRNEATVAASCTIDFLRPAFAGQQLTATAQERALPGRTGVYDVAVTNGQDQLVALFRGRSHRIKGEVIPLDTDTRAN